MLEANNNCVKNVNCCVLLSSIPLKIDRKVWQVSVVQTTVLNHNTVRLSVDDGNLEPLDKTGWVFDVLLTVHLSIILVINQVNPYRTNVENRVSS